MAVTHNMEMGPMDIKIEKRDYDAIAGILKSSKRKFNDDERNALEMARIVFAVKIAENMEDGTATQARIAKEIERMADRD